MFIQKNPLNLASKPKIIAGSEIVPLLFSDNATLDKSVQEPMLIPAFVHVCAFACVGDMQQLMHKDIGLWQRHRQEHNGPFSRWLEAITSPAASRPRSFPETNLHKIHIAG